MNNMVDLDNLQKTIGTKFKDTSLLRQAFIHRSFLNENKEEPFSNERLEFLGDSVLSILVSTELYKRYPHYPEGKLTNLRSLLVKGKTLSEIAKNLGLGNALQMSRGEEKSGGRENSSLLADTLEAILGAIYLDQGLPTAKKFLEKFLFPLISEVEKRQELADYKSELQELTQEKTKLSPVYKVIEEIGPDHDKTFKVAVSVHARQLAVGEGKSKQAAEQDAARLALKDKKI